MLTFYAKHAMNGAYGTHQMKITIKLCSILLRIQVDFCYNNIGGIILMSSLYPEVAISKIAKSHVHTFIYLFTFSLTVNVRLGAMFTNLRHTVHILEIAV